MRRALSISILAFLVGCWAALTHASGQTLSVAGSASAPDTGRDAFAEVPNIPWYNAETDSLRRVDLPASREPPSPGKWEQDRRPDTSRQNRNWNWNFDRFWEFFQMLIWLFLVVLAVIGIWLIVRAYLRGEAAKISGNRGESLPSARVTDVERLDNLSFDVPSDMTDLLGATRRRYEQGQYGEAIVFLFSYQLVQMDKHQLLHLVRGKTNRQYLRELSSRKDLRHLVSQTMLAFEDFFFGKYPIAPERFEACWTQVDRFHELIHVEPPR